MDLFEFILIITSVIFALAVAQILSGISRIAQSTVIVRPYLAHSVWVFNLFIFIFLIWWASWEFRNADWTFAKYAYMLVAPTLLYFACSLLVPQRLEGDTVSMEAHFFRVRRPLFLAYLLTVVTVVVDGNLLADEPVWHSARYVHISMIVLSLIALFRTGRRLHNVVALLTTLSFFLVVVIRFWIPR